MEDVPNFWANQRLRQSKLGIYCWTGIKRDYNHPSVSPGFFSMKHGAFSAGIPQQVSVPILPKHRNGCVVVHKVKTIDPTRLVEDNSPCNLDHVITDINTWHSYNPARQWAGLFDEIVSKTYPGSTYNYIGGNVQGNEPMFNSECGAVWDIAAVQVTLTLLGISYYDEWIP